MTARPPLHWLLRDRHGTTAVEFALLAGVLLPMLFGIVGLGFLMWTHNALQTTAALTARCVAIGSSLCSANPAQFAVNTAQQWIVPGIINVEDVDIQTAATSCNGVAGPFVTVAIASSFWASVMLPPLAASTLQVNTCFPVSAG
jgi:Flp pilus assembly protein TadG